jgi:hypothetical protein
MLNRFRCISIVSAVLLLPLQQIYSQSVSLCKPPNCIPDSIRTLGLIVLDYNSYYLTAGGIYEYNGQLSDSGQAQLIRSITSALQKKGFVIKLFPKEEKDPALMDVQALYRTVKYEIDEHVNGMENTFYTRVNDFDYSLGSVKDQVSRYGVDGLLYVYGYDETRTRLRSVVAGEAQAAAVAGAVTSAIMRAFLGFSLGGGGISLRKDYSIVSAGLIAGSGAICWYNRIFKVGNYNLCSAEHADLIADELVESIRARRVKP